jgi:hypothetical protein
VSGNSSKELSLRASEAQLAVGISTDQAAVSRVEHRFDFWSIVAFWLHPRRNGCVKSVEHHSSRCSDGDLTIVIGQGQRRDE